MNPANERGPGGHRGIDIRRYTYRFDYPGIQVFVSTNRRQRPTYNLERALEFWARNTGQYLDLIPAPGMVVGIDIRSKISSYLDAGGAARTVITRRPTPNAVDFVILQNHHGPRFNRMELRTLLWAELNKALLDQADCRSMMEVHFGTHDPSLFRAVRLSWAWLEKGGSK
jgi:hypothetical protein